MQDKMPVQLSCLRVHLHRVLKKGFVKQLTKFFLLQTPFLLLSLLSSVVFFCTPVRVWFFLITHKLSCSLILPDALFSLLSPDLFTIMIPADTRKSARSPDRLNA